MKFEAGQEVYLVYNNTRKEGRIVTIGKVGRKYGYLESDGWQQSERFRLSDGINDNGTYSGDWKLWPSREVYEDNRLAQSLWHDTVRKVKLDTLTEYTVNKIREILDIRTSPQSDSGGA